MADALRANGTITANAGAVPISPNGRGCVAIELTGTWVANLDVKSLVDGTEENAKIYNAAGAVVALPLTTNQIVYAYAAGREQIIIRANGFTSGSAAVVMNATDGLPFVAGAGGGGPVTAANPGDFVDGWDATFGAKADASAAADNSTATYMSLFKRLLARLTTLLPQNSGRLNVDGAGGTFPVTNANLDAATSTLLTISDFDTKTGSLTETAPATDTASSGLNGRLQRVAQRLTSLIALFPTALGTTTAANSLPVTLASDSTYATLQGGVTETAPATDTASSGANGRLQRVAQRLSSLIALLPTALISNRLDVNLGAAPAIVTAGGLTPAAPTCTFTRGANATPYTIGDEVGTSGTAPTTISVARINGGSGTILGAQVVYSSYTATIPQLVVLLFSATVTLAGDNAQLNLSDGDAALCIGVIPLTATQSGQYSAGAPVAAGNTLFFGAPTAPIEFTAGGGQQTIYAALITLNAFTPIANSETAILTLRVEGN